MSECNDNASTWTHVLPDRRRKFPSGKYAADRKWLLLETKCRSFNRFFKLPIALLLVPTYGQRRPGLGKLGIRKTIFYKPMGLVCFESFPRAFSDSHVCVHAVCSALRTKSNSACFYPTSEENEKLPRNAGHMLPPDSREKNTILQQGVRKTRTAQVLHI